MSLPLALPESRETGGGAEFPGFCLLTSSDLQGVLEGRFGFSGVVYRQLEQEFALEVVEVDDRMVGNASRRTAPCTNRLVFSLSKMSPGSA